MNKSLTLEDISTILEMLEDHDVRDFKFEREGEKLALKRGPQPGEGSLASVQQVMTQSSQPFFQPQFSAPQTQEVFQSPAAPQPAPTNNYSEVSSPMVGTFYSRPAADADAYVQVGDIVKKGQVLCIIEAMKIMNEIESDASGRVVQICLEDSQMVEYGEVIFRIDPLA